MNPGIPVIHTKPTEYGLTATFKLKEEINKLKLYIIVNESTSLLISFFINLTVNHQ